MAPAGALRFSPRTGLSFPPVVAVPVVLDSFTTAPFAFPSVIEGESLTPPRAESQRIPLGHEPITSRVGPPVAAESTMPRSSYLFRDFVTGKSQSKRLGFEPDVIPEVVAVEPHAVDRVLGVRRREDRLAVLRALRSRGMLVCRPPGRLTQRVRFEDGKGGFVRAKLYCFKASSTDQVAAAADEVRGR